MLHRLFIQAGNRIRTGDLNLGKVALYQLSYAREVYYIVSALEARKPGPRTRP